MRNKFVLFCIFVLSSLTACDDNDRKPYLADNGIVDNIQTTNSNQGKYIVTLKKDSIEKYNNGHGTMYFSTYFTFYTNIKYTIGDTIIFQKK